MTDDRDEEETIEVCPECDSASIHILTPRRSDVGPDRPRYRCKDCNHHFTHPVRRPRRQHGRGLSGHAGTLKDADPDDIDLQADGSGMTCPDCGSGLTPRGGCPTCLECGYRACTGGPAQ